jgi:sensor histidine kinase YesM
MFRNIRYQYKLFMAFALLILIIMVVSAIFFYLYTSSIILGNIKESQYNAIEVNKEKLDRTLLEMDNLAKELNYSEQIMDLMKNIEYSTANYFDDHPRDNDFIKNSLYSNTAYQPVNGRISVISRYYDYTFISNSYRNLTLTKQQLRANERISSMMESEEYMAFFPPHIDEFTTDSSEVFTLNRPLRDNFNIYGIIEVSKNITELDKLFKSENPEDSYMTALYDDNGAVIYSNFTVPENIDPGKLFNSSKVIDQDQTGDYLVEDSSGNSALSAVFSKLDNVDWYIVQLESTDTLYQSVTNFRTIVIITYIFSFAVLLSFLYLITSSLTKPIQKLTHLLTDLNISKNINIKIPTTNNEIVLLNQAMQSMLEKIQLSTKERIESHEREVSARFEILQSQLNPHFLYNTLTVITAFCQKTGNDRVSIMCKQLAELIQYTVDRSQKNTTLLSEFKNIDSYLYLMKMRYQKFLEYSIDFSKEMESIKVPKLILQPIVENCFKHGFIDIDPVWNVEVSGYIKDDYWYVKISDNGKGFTPTAVKDFLKRIDRAKASLFNHDISIDEIKSEGVGLFNTVLRLSLYYSKKEYFQICGKKYRTIMIGGPLDGKI